MLNRRMPNGMYGGVRGERKSPLLDRNHLQMKYFLDCELFGGYHSYIRCEMLYDGRNAMTDKELVQKVHKETFYFVQELVKEEVPLSKSVIKQVYYLVLADKKDDRGGYRRVPVRIMGANHQSVQAYLKGTGLRI